MKKLAMRYKPNNFLFKSLNYTISITRFSSSKTLTVYTVNYYRITRNR